MLTKGGSGTQFRVHTVFRAHVRVELGKALNLRHTPAKCLSGATPTPTPTPPSLSVSLRLRGHNTHFSGIGQTDCLPRTSVPHALASVLHKNRQAGKSHLRVARVCVWVAGFGISVVCLFFVGWFVRVRVFGFSLASVLMNGRRHWRTCEFGQVNVTNEVCVCV